MLSDITEHNYFRFELKSKTNNKHVRHGIGWVFGDSVLDRLPATPETIKNNYQHWFTKQGFEQFGRNIISKFVTDGLHDSFTLKLRKVKKLPAKIKFRDGQQVAIEYK